MSSTCQTPRCRASWDRRIRPLTPDSSGALEVGAEVADARASTGSGWEATSSASSRSSAGDQAAPPAPQALNLNLYEPFGPFELDAGAETITLAYSDSRLHPGGGGDPTPLGPIILERVQPGDRGTVSVQASEYRQLCGESWDWIEAYG